MGFWGSLGKGLLAGGATIAAPFTGGASLATVLPAIFSGAAAVGGALENRKSARTGTSNTTATSTQTATLSPQAQSLADSLAGIYRSRLGGDSLPAGYEEGGIRGINNTYDRIAQNINNDITSRGLATSPMGSTAAVSGELARGGDVARFESGIPLVRRQLQDEDMASALSFMNSLPRTVTSTGNNAGSYTMPGSALGSGISDAATMLAYLYGQGAFKRQGQPSALTGSPALTWAMAPHV